MRYLFVGGPKHGEIINVADNRSTVLLPEAIPLDHDYWLHPNALQSAPSMRVVDYLRTDVGTDRIIYIARGTNK